MMNPSEIHQLTREMVEDANRAYDDFKGYKERDFAKHVVPALRERGRLWAETTLPSFWKYDSKRWVSYRIFKRIRKGKLLEDIRQYYVNRAMLRNVVPGAHPDGTSEFNELCHKMENFEFEFNALCHKAYTPVEVPDDLVVFDTPETIEGARLLALAAALEFEVKTGMKRSSRGRATSTIIKEAMLKHGFKLTSRKKANLLKEYEGCLQELGVLQV